MKKYLELLGKEVIDIVTGFKGIVVSVSFDLSGCIQALVKPKCNKDGKLEDSKWIDEKRLKIGKSILEKPLFDYIRGGELLPRKNDKSI